MQKDGKEMKSKDLLPVAWRREKHQAELCGKVIICDGTFAPSHTFFFLLIARGQWCLLSYLIKINKISCKLFNLTKNKIK
jgi:hypothetical protein